MQWVCTLEVQGLYAGVARSSGLVPADRPAVVLKEGRVFDGCREAFAAGLALGAPARQAMRDVPRAVQIDLSQVNASARARTWWDGCLAYTPYVEPVDLHRIFLALPTPGTALTRELKNEVARLVELAATVGFVAFAGTGTSRLVARAAALACKESWLLRRPGAAGRASAPEVSAFVAPGEEERFLAPLPIQYLPAPPEVLRRLGRLGLRTIGEAARIPQGEWLRQLGPLGHQVALWSHGIDPEPVKPAYPPRSLERRVQFTPEVGDRDHLEQVVNRSGALLAAKLAGKGEGCQQVSLVLEPSGGPPVRAERTLAKLQQEVYPVQQALRGLLNEALQALRQPGAEQAEPGFAAGEPAVAALQVELSLIGPMPWQQLDLWEDQARRERDERLQRALSLLHQRFPARVVGLGPGQGVSWREQMLGFNDPFRWAAAAP